MGGSSIKTKRLSKLAYGDSLPNEQRIKGDVPVFGSNGKVGYHNCSNTISPVIIVGRKGSYGKLNYSDLPSFVIDTAYYIDESQTKSPIRWLFYALFSLKLDTQSKDAAVPGLSRDDAYRKIIFLPPRDEQAQIACFLDHKSSQISRFIRAKKRMIALLKEQKQAIIDDAVTGKIDVRTGKPYPKYKEGGVEWLGKVPEGWEVRKIKHIAKMKSGENITSMSIEDIGEYPVYGGNGLRGYFSDFTHDGEFLLIGRQGALCGNVHFVSGKFWASEHAVVTTIVTVHSTFVKFSKNLQFRACVLYFRCYNLFTCNQSLPTGGNPPLPMM